MLAKDTLVNSGGLEYKKAPMKSPVLSFFIINRLQIGSCSALILGD